MLNPNQLTAIQDIYEPTLVIAGPGTGKTELLSGRVAKIIENTGDNPNNILCLTYSKAGVKAMRDRLAKNINKAFSEEVPIHTFHSFCASVIKEHSTYFSSKAKYLIDDIKFYEFLYPLITNSIIAGENYTEKPPTDFLLGNFKKIFTVVKEEKLCLTELVNQANTKLDELYTKEQTKSLQDDIGKIKKFRDALSLILHLQYQLDAAGLYDYNDMLYWVIEFFNLLPEELQNYREKYLYVLVDEFQDTNPLQLTLLNQLIIKNGDSSPSFFAVGDDDQCIYRFQGASVNTIINLNHELPTVKRVVLTENYRSTQDILDMAGRLIVHNENRVVNRIEGLSKDLVASKKENIGIQTIPRIWHCNDKKHEAKIILADIKHKIDTGEAIPGDFAILYRNRSHGEEIIDLVKKSGLSYSSKDDNSNLLNMGFVMDIDNALQLIRTESIKMGSGDAYLFKIILNHKERYNVLDVIDLMNHLKSQPFSKKSFVQNLQYFESSDVYSQLFLTIRSITLRLLGLTIHINTVMTPSHWSEIMSALEIERTENEIWKDWDSFFDSEKVYRKDATILDWSELFARFHFYSKSIDSSKELSKEGIKLLTVHGSKGLEFKHVYIIGCSNNKWEKPDKFNTGIKFPDYLNRINDGELEDKRRLFYVAITRAERSITFSYYKDGIGKYGKYELSIYVKQAVPNFVELTQRINTKPSIPQKNIDYKKILGNHLALVISKINKEYRFSPSTFKNFISCSSKFLLNDILRMPSSGNEMMSFGSAIHAMFELLFENKIYLKSIEEADTFIDTNWPKIMEESKHLFIRDNKKQYEIYGLPTIKKYYSNFIHGKILTNEISQEVDLTGMIGSARIKGRIDRIDILGNDVFVFDYKTGYGGSEKWKIFEDDDNIGGDHWRQAKIYATLVESNYPDKKMQAVHFHYLERKEKKDIISTLSPGPRFPKWESYIESNWRDLQELRLQNPCMDINCECCSHLIE